MVHLSLTLMGPFEALLDGQTITGFQSNKVRALLAYLAVESTRPQSRETLAGLLWPDGSDDCAHHSLNQALCNLRKVLRDRAAIPPFLAIAPQTIQFNKSSSHWLDTEEISSLVRRGDGAGGDSGNRQNDGPAVDLYRGPFLEGLSLADCPAFEEWVVIQSERLHRLLLEAMHTLACACAGRGEYEQALRYTWRQLELDPWLEDAHRQAIRWLALSGRRSEALVQYGVCWRRLAHELGVEPSAETTRLYQQIRNGEIGG